MKKKENKPEEQKENKPEQKEKPNLAFELEKAGYGESQMAQSLKQSISFLKAYEMEHRVHQEILSSLTWHKFICLKKMGFTPDQAMGIIINKPLFEF